MKTNIIKKGFTLIELLVVITIIGILATGGISIYTTQIQKARDSVRITAITELEASAEQVYQNDTKYPQTNTFISEVAPFLKKIPRDPKHGQPCSDGSLNNSDCAYAYTVDVDINGIELGSYEFSTAFENAGNINNKADNIVDGGNDDSRREIFGSRTNLDTAVAKNDITTPSQEGACAPGGGSPASTTVGIPVIILVAGSGSCV